MEHLFAANITDISGHSSVGRARVLDLDVRARIKRAMKKGAAFFFAGLIFVPVPFIHFFVPPAFFVVSAVSFFSTLKETRTIPLIEAECPACHAQVQFKNQKFAGTKKDVCPSCRQQLQFSLESQPETATL